MKKTDLSLQTDTDMGSIKPSINFKGFQRALNEYPEKAIPEELAANSYDAYASSFLLLLDEFQNKLYCIDDGNGFDEQAMQEMMTLGGGGKEYVQSGERVFLGSYGFGLKAVLKIADRMQLTSCSSVDNMKYFADIDLGLFESKMRPDSEGYKFDPYTLPSKESKGTVIVLSLKKLTTKTELEEFAKGLVNLPTHSGNFNCYYGFYSEAKELLSPYISTFTGLREITKKLFNENKIKLAANLFDSELEACEVNEIADKEDPAVKGKFYFTKTNNDGVRDNLKESLRGIYVRVNGRLLKADFDTSKYTSKISKYIQFKSSMRTELSIDWLRTEITLSRDGVSFRNEKLESDFMKVISSMISKFLKPRLEKNEKIKLRAEDAKLKKRRELANKRVSKSADAVIKDGKSGFIFKPDTDAELAILIAQDYIMNKINPNFKLIDYNAQAPFDCMIYDESRADYLYTELEPSLIDFLAHKNKSNIQLIIVWTINKWGMGHTKKGNNSWFRLIYPDNSPKGNYRLLEVPSENSEKIKRHFQVIVVEELLK